MNITGTTISFDLYEVLRGATPVQAADIADALSLHGAVRKNVIDSIVEGATTMQSGPAWDEADAEHKRILEALPQMEQDRIARLERKAAQAAEKIAKLEAIIRTCQRLCDDGPGYVETYSVRKVDLRKALEG
jgi:FMN phosphatase YigB (HAD superfamily)